MKDKDYSRSIELLCPTCAANDFDFDESLVESAREYSCKSCESVFSYQDIVDSNGERVAAAVDEVKKEITDDLSKMVRDTFKGLKGWTLK